MGSKLVHLGLGRICNKIWVFGMWGSNYVNIKLAFILQFRSCIRTSIRWPRWLKDFYDSLWAWESRNRPCLLTHSRLGKLWTVLLNVWDLRPTSFGRFNDLNLTLTDAQKAGHDSNSFDWSEFAEATDHITNTRQMAGTIR